MSGYNSVTSRWIIFQNTTFLNLSNHICSWTTFWQQMLVCFVMIVLLTDNDITHCSVWNIQSTCAKYSFTTKTQLRSSLIYVWKTGIFKIKFGLNFSFNKQYISMLSVKTNIWNRQFWSYIIAFLFSKKSTTHYS